MLNTNNNETQAHPHVETVFIPSNFGCNVYLVRNGDKVILIDTSMKKYNKQIVNKLKELKVTSDELNLCVITHSHFDHVLGLEQMRNKSEFKNMKVLVHKNESEYVKSGKGFLPEGTNFFAKSMVWLGRNVFTKSKNFDPCEVDIELEEEIFKEEKYGFNEKFYVMHTPGHTSGSLSVIVGDCAVVGDLIFNKSISKIYPPYCNDIKQAMANWRKLIEMGIKTFYPGHGEPASWKLVAEVYNKYNPDNKIEIKKDNKNEVKEDDKNEVKEDDKNEVKEDLDKNEINEE